MEDERQDLFSVLLLVRSPLEDLLLDFLLLFWSPLEDMLPDFLLLFWSPDFFFVPVVLLLRSLLEDELQDLFDPELDRGVAALSTASVGLLEVGTVST